MVWLKPLELGFRRFLTGVLKFFLRKKKPFPAHLDFNLCKFLFLRQDLIGDALVSTPVFDLLKRRYPGAVIDVLMSPKNHFTLEHNPAIRKRWIYKKTPRELMKLRKQIRQEQYDFVVDLLDNPSTTSTLWCLNARAKWRVGLAKENDFCYDFVAPMLPKSEFHIVERTANVLLAFRIDPGKEILRIRYYVSPQSEKSADKFWSENGFTDKTVVGVNISAGDEVRSWWGKNCIEVLSEMTKRHPEWKILLLFKPEDSHKARSISQAVPSLIFSPPTPTFDHIAALVKRVRILVTPDTSIVQIASAFNIPSVVLHLRLSALHGHLWEPYKSDAVNLVASVDHVETIPAKDIISAFERLASRNISLRSHGHEQATHTGL
jgi:ADP-heptose:LPS heptosyltransferase